MTSDALVEGTKKIIVDSLVLNTTLSMTHIMQEKISCHTGKYKIDEQSEYKY